MHRDWVTLVNFAAFKTTSADPGQATKQSRPAALRCTGWRLALASASPGDIPMQSNELDYRYTLGAKQ